ncbi:hypothetical protein N7462_000753 [Penicillium macrosclerotiorum]|uniref:uncharacterized protein n=1 Tax=Penicillium macrosclerotiorum TaxID=303699 RepID=UPI0025465873|nr:uncharacterized protein N7462_000753 [Penicillium macrosclerotiorum]KAJ5698748.1 hypothetical protein N7462_000753 [Penicillium macrosclerotiorum]
MSRQIRLIRPIKLIELIELIGPRPETETYTPPVAVRVSISSPPRSSWLLLGGHEGTMPDENSASDSEREEGLRKTVYSCCLLHAASTGSIYVYTSYFRILKVVTGGMGPDTLPGSRLRHQKQAHQEAVNHIDRGKYLNRSLDPGDNPVDHGGVQAQKQTTAQATRAGVESIHPPVTNNQTASHGQTPTDFAASKLPGRHSSR